MNASIETPPVDSPAQKIIIHTFTYAGDAKLTLEHALCIQMSMPEAHLVIIDDGHNPCPGEVREKLEQLGAEWRVSRWNRNRNLRGKEAILGIVDEMLASPCGENDVLMKIDQDTALLNGRELREFVQGEKILWGSTSNICLLHGCAYAVRAHALKKARTILASTPLPSTAPEDISIARAVLYLYPEEHHRELSRPCTRETPHSVWAGYHWGTYPNVTSYRRFSVVVTGNRPEPPLTREHRVEVMRSLRLLRQSH